MLAFINQNISSVSFSPTQPKRPPDKSPPDTSLSPPDALPGQQGQGSCAPPVPCHPAVPHLSSCLTPFIFKWLSLGFAFFYLNCGFAAVTFLPAPRRGGQQLPMAAPRSLLTRGFERVQSLACLCLLAIALNRAFRWIFFFFTRLPGKTSSETFPLSGFLIFTLTL